METSNQEDRLTWRLLKEQRNDVLPIMSRCHQGQSGLFFCALVNAARRGKVKQSKADPCSLHAWNAFGLIMRMGQVDDCVAMGDEQGALAANQLSMKHFLREEQGPFKDWVGCEVGDEPDVHDERQMKLAQPVLSQSLKDELCSPEGGAPSALAGPGQVPAEAESGEESSDMEQTACRSAMGKKLHTTHWSRPDCFLIALFPCIFSLHLFLMSKALLHCCCFSSCCCFPVVLCCCCSCFLKSILSLKLTQPKRQRLVKKASNRPCDPSIAIVAIKNGTVRVDPSCWISCWPVSSFPSSQALSSFSSFLSGSHPARSVESVLPVLTTHLRNPV